MISSELLAQRFLRRRRDHHAAVGLDEVLREEVHLPGQLLDVERDAVGQVVGRLELGAAALHGRDQPDRLPIQRRVLRRRRRAEVRLQRHVAQILEREHADVVGMAEDARNRHRHLLEQPRDVHERQRFHVERGRVQGQDEWRSRGREHPVVAPIRRVAGQRHDPRAVRGQAAPPEVHVDPLPLLGGVGVSLVRHRFTVSKTTGLRPSEVPDQEASVAPLARPGRLSDPRHQRTAAVARSGHHPRSIADDAVFEHRILADRHVIPDRGSSQRRRWMDVGPRAADEMVSLAPGEVQRRLQVVGRGADVAERCVDDERRQRPGAIPG